jgi:hypothetical protein
LGKAFVAVACLVSMADNHIEGTTFT